MTLLAVDRLFQRWFGQDYDLDAIHAVLATAAAIQLDGDPVWLLLVGGPGNVKTETVCALGQTKAHVVSTISSEGALLSGTSKGERSADATGGLLRRLGDVGVLVLKDFTSILSLSQSVRPGVLAAFREIYDGNWRREIGADGGRVLEWKGRIAVVGAVTTEWDQAHATVSAMGDRFVLLRMESRHRLTAGRKAIENTGSELQMRAELSGAVADLMRRMNLQPVRLDEADREALLRAADLVTSARTAVLRDRQGNVLDAHAAEMPTRFAKQLAQLVRGGVAIGLTKSQAMRLALRCARDSVPPLRLAILRDLHNHPRSLVSDVRKRLQKPHNTIDRELQALQMLGVVFMVEDKSADQYGRRTYGYYSLSREADVAALFPEIVQPPNPTPMGQRSTSISGSAQNLPLAV